MCSKYIAEKTGSDEFKYSMDEFEKLRRNEDVMVMKHFMDNYVSAVVGKQKFKRAASIALLSSFVTVSDEAFALLTIKNNWEVWPAKFRNKGKDQDDMEPIPRTKYTNRRRYGKLRDGWTKDGQREFLKYYNMVTDDRRSAEGIEMEKKLLEIYRGECSNRGMPMETNDDEDDDIVFIPTDWDTSNDVAQNEDEERNPSGDKNSMPVEKV